jgi:hypothetical protein
VVAEKVLCDEAVIRHVEQDRLGQIRESIGKDPSRVPQVVFLSLLEHDADPRRSVQVHLAKPRATLNSHVFKILVHTVSKWFYDTSTGVATEAVPLWFFCWRSSDRTRCWLSGNTVNAKIYVVRAAIA